MDLLELVRKRSVPGILIFDHGENLIFFNPAARDILREHKGIGQPSIKNGLGLTIPKEIDNFYSRLKKVLDSRHRNPGSMLPSPIALFSTKEADYCCRGSFLQGFSKTDREVCPIMIFIEKVRAHRKADLETFKKRFGLTDRQTKIVKRLLTGWRNEDIAHEFCVREDAIKWYLKTIMKRLGVHSRTEILSKIYQL
jgi:DNA-binding CsgD family transcriptional regulator